MEVINRFKEARLRHNQHGKQDVKTVCSQTGITRSLLDDLELDARKPRETSYIKIAELAKYYGVSMDYLAGISDVPSIDLKTREICKYTGLCEDAIIALHYIASFCSEDDEEYRTIAMLNRIFSGSSDGDPDAESKEDDPQLLTDFLVKNILAVMDRYITSDSIRSLDDYLRQGENGNSVKLWDPIKVVSSQNMFEFLQLQPAYRAAKKEQIEEMLERYRSQENENNTDKGRGEQQ